MEGWIKIHRSLLKHWIWNVKPFSQGQAWIDLLLLANHSENSKLFIRGIEVSLRRGDVGWSSVNLSDRWGWSRSKLRTFLNRLEKEQQIKQQKNNITLIISIINYDEYQQTGQQNGQQTEQQKDSRKTAKGQQKDTNKNDKNVKNEKKIGEGQNFSPENIEIKNKVKEYWERWKKYKDIEYGFKYKSDISEDTAKKMLFKMADGKLENVIEIIDYTIGKGYKGFINPKTENNGKQGRKQGATVEQVANAIIKGFEIDSSNSS